MKKINLVLLFTLISLTEYAQNSLFSNLQGFTYKQNQYFELAGTQITVIPNNVKFDSKGIKKIKKYYNLKNITKEFRDSTITQENLVIEASVTENKLIKNYLCYLFPKSENLVDVITFGSRLSIDSSVVKPFIDEYLNNQLSKYAPEIGNDKVDSINFVGKIIILDDNCSYVTPNNIQCQRYGQISWSIFDSKERAEAYESSMVKMGGSNPSFKMVSDTIVNVIFEGTKTSARRFVYKTKFTESIVYGKQIICVYYIIQKVRGWYVSAILTYNMYDENNFELTPLLKKIMSLDLD